MLTLYDNASSGNGYKIRLILALTGTAYDHREVPFTAAGTRGEPFQAINPLGQIPCVVFDDGRVLCQSNAILVYFAEGTSFLPQDQFLRAKVFEWLFFEQYSLEPYIAVIRHWLHDDKMTDLQKAQLPEKRERGYRALSHMEARLSGAEWLVGPLPTIADLALFAYTHVAHEGHFDLTSYPGILNWIERVKILPDYVPMGVSGPNTQG